MRFLFSSGEQSKHTEEKPDIAICCDVCSFIWESNYNTSYKARDYNLFLLSLGKQVDSALQPVGLEPATRGCRPTS